MSSEERKVCRKCGVEKDISAFGKHVTGAGGFRASCKPCSNVVSAAWHASNKGRKAVTTKAWGARNRDRKAATAKAWALANPARQRSHSRRRATGASARLQATIWANQGGRCAICADPQEPRSANLDHCHTSGVVRGFLCAHCNRGLGGFRDRPELLRGAAAYLEVHQSTDRETAQ
jgi:hypothetical protein